MLSFRLRSPIVLSVVVFGIALAGTFFVARSMTDRTDAIAQAKFDTWTGEMMHNLTEQMTMDVNALEGVRGLFAASDAVEQEEFEAYITSLDIAVHYPGIDAMSFLKTADDGTAIVTYIEPAVGNERALGFDAASEPVRAAALLQARDTGQPAATRKLTLVNGHPGFAVLLPVYANGMPISTVSERRAALVGFVAASFRTDRLFQDLIEKDVANIVTHFEIFDSATADEAHVLYESAHHDAVIAAADRMRTETIAFTVAGNPWTIRFFAPSDFGLGSHEQYSARVLFVGGLTLSILLAFLVYTLAMARVRALKIAEGMTADLRTTQQRLRSLYEITTRAELSLEEQVREALQVGAHALHTKLAVLSHIADGTFTVRHCYDPDNGLHEGDAFALAETYCDITVQKQDVVAIDAMRTSPYSAHACYAKFKLESYIGVPVNVNGTLFGTLAFLAPDPHHPGFTESDHDFVRLLGKWVAAALEHEILAKKADEVDKMKSEFVSLASHQLRTPLTGIKWFADLLLRGSMGAVTKDQQEALQAIADSNARLIGLVEDLLNISHIETGRKFNLVMTPTDLAPIIASLEKDVIALAAQHQVRVEKTADFPTQIMANVDGEKMREVLQNLLTNAIKYSHDGGVVTLGYAATPKDMTISVEDHGLGIPKAQQGRMFEKFFRADNVQTKETTGTGLGLYIAKAIVEKHGGRLTFTSEENKGSTFSVTLPVVA